MNLYILGNGGYANELFDQLFLEKNNYTFQGFIIMKDDKAFVITDLGISPFNYSKNASFILGTQNLLWRTIFINHLSNYYELSNKHFPNIISNKAHVSKTSILGIGNSFSPFSSINGITIIGNFNIFSNYSSIYNNCTIGNYNILGPYASIMRNCDIEDNNILNANCVITEKITVGSENIVGASECVFDNLNSKELFQSGIVMRKSIE